MLERGFKVSTPRVKTEPASAGKGTHSKDGRWLEPEGGDVSARVAEVEFGGPPFFLKLFFGGFVAFLSADCEVFEVIEGAWGAFGCRFDGEGFYLVEAEGLGEEVVNFLNGEWFGGGFYVVAGHLAPFDESGEGVGCLGGGK